MTAIVVVSFVNVLVQAGLLALSLSALATSQNVTPPWVAIVMAVAGMLLLLWTVTSVGLMRRRVAEFDASVHN